MQLAHFFEDPSTGLIANFYEMQLNVVILKQDVMDIMKQNPPCNPQIFILQYMQ